MDVTISLAAVQQGSGGPALNTPFPLRGSWANEPPSFPRGTPMSLAVFVSDDLRHGLSWKRKQKIAFTRRRW